jgi:hypothetical protein
VQHPGALLGWSAYNSAPRAECLPVRAGGVPSRGEGGGEWSAEKHVGGGSANRCGRSAQARGACLGNLANPTKPRAPRGLARQVRNHLWELSTKSNPRPESLVGTEFDLARVFCGSFGAALGGEKRQSATAFAGGVPTSAREVPLTGGCGVPFPGARAGGVRTKAGRVPVKRGRRAAVAECQGGGLPTTMLRSG